MNIAHVISWKFNDQPGMRCKEIDGVMTIIDFPGGIPSQAEQDQWIAEYAAAEPWKDQQIEEELGSDAIRIIIETIVPMIQDGSITSITPGQVIAQAKTNRRAEL
jgi:hypothetical protein